MSNIIIDKQTLIDFNNRGIKSIKLYFYDAGCSGTKLNIEEKPDLGKLIKLDTIGDIEVYSSVFDKEKFEDCTITRTVAVDHTGNEKISYIYKSEKVRDRCGCGSSFSFGEKKIKIDLDKFRELKKNINK